MSDSNMEKCKTSDSDTDLQQTQFTQNTNNSNNSNKSNNSNNSKKKPTFEKRQSLSQIKNQSFEDFKNGFLKDIDLISVNYNCYLCGKNQTTYVFHERRYNLARTCHHNIDASFGAKCGIEEKAAEDNTNSNNNSNNNSNSNSNNSNSNSNCNKCTCNNNSSNSNSKKKKQSKKEIVREYTNWDMEYEYTSKFENKKYGSIYMMWNQMNLQCAKITGPAAKKTLDVLDKRKKVEKNIISFKKFYFEKVVKKVEKANEMVLAATTRRIDLLSKTIRYWLKIQRLFAYKDNPLWNQDRYGDCYGCGMNYFLATQYEKTYISPYARQVLHLVDDFIKGTTNFFVCGRCIMQCIGSGGHEYGILQTVSLGYSKDWKDVEYPDKSVFIMGHLNHVHFPLHIAWFDLLDNKWKYGKILELVSPQAYTIRVKIINDNNREAIIPFATMNECEYFLFQRPSSDHSPLYKPGNKDKEILFSPDNTVLNVTHPQITTRYCSKDRMYDNGRETMKFNWVVPLIHQGHRCESFFFQVMHFKDVFMYLRTQNLLSPPEYVFRPYDNANNSNSKNQFS